MNQHRVAVARTVIGPRVRITTGSIVKTTNLVLCGDCGEPVTLRRGPARDVWVHGRPEGVIEAVSGA